MYASGTRRFFRSIHLQWCAANSRPTFHLLIVITCGSSCIRISLRSVGLGWVEDDRHISFKYHMTKHPVTGNGATVESVGSFLKFQWRIPLYRNDAQYSTTKVKRANRYLLHQNIRISRLIKAKKFKDALECFKWMLKTSKSFKVYALNRWYSGWYHNQSFNQVKRTFRLLDKKFRELPISFGVTRTYIPKKNGKLRPLGIPAVPDRILNSAWASFIAACFEEIRRNQQQHGFRKNRGLHTAWAHIREITKETLRTFRIYELDFKSFFNTINPIATRKALSKLNCGIENYVEALNSVAIARFTQFEEEMEYRRNDKGQIVKNGNPQGMPWSPVLSMMVLDDVGFEYWWCVMFADDVVMFFQEGESMANFFENNPKWERSGIQLAPEKCGWVDDKLTFLGSTLDLKTRLLTNEKGTISIDSPDETLFKFVGKSYANGGLKHWKWNVHNKSWLSLHHPAMHGLSPLKYIKCLLVLGWKDLTDWLIGPSEEVNQLVHMLIGSDKRRYKWIIYSVGQVSTQACSYMLQHRRAQDPILSQEKKRRSKVNRSMAFEDMRPTYASTWNPMKIDINGKTEELVTIPSIPEGKGSFGWLIGARYKDK